MTSILPPLEFDMAEVLDSVEDHQSEMAPCYDALSEILETFTERDVRNFLFTDEAIEHPYFTSPNFTKSAVTSTLVSKRRCRDVVENLQGYMVYIPAFNIAYRNFGFGYHCHYNDDMSRRERSSARFVHDDSAGTFLTVLQSDDERLIMTYRKYLTTTCQKRFTANFDRRAFLKAIHEDLLIPEILVSTLRQLLMGLEFRNCPYCGRSECDCSVVLKRPRHPFDDKAFKEGLNLLMGSFRGFATLETYENGHVVNGEKVECEIVVNETDNAKVTEELRGWASKRTPIGTEEVWKKDMNNGLNIERKGLGRKKTDGVVSELKAALRKERNRASARKSNMKKKIMNDSLKAAVLGERKRLERLRGRELELRRKNLELRRLLVDDV